LRERVLAIVNLIATYVLSSEQSPISEQELIEKLLSVGYQVDEIDDAFSWMASNALRPATDGPKSVEPFTDPTYRIFSPQERQAFTPDALGLMVRLRSMGIVSDDSLEEILQRAAQQTEGPVGLQDIKLVTAIVLLSRSSSLWQKEINCIFDDDWSRIYH